MSQPKVQPRVASEEAERLHAIIRDYLEAVDRDGDHERMAQRLAKKRAEGERVVGFRRRGQEVLLYYDPTPHESSILSIQEMSRDGRLARVGVLWKGRDLEEWIAQHHHYLEWVDPAYRKFRF